MKIENYKYHSIVNYEPGLNIVWDRGKKFFSYEVTEELAEKSRKSNKDALEVMFYLEYGRWPKEGELENYNKTDVKTYVGDGFTIYEENGMYEIGIEKQNGGASLGEIYYPITKELKEKAFKSSKDAYEVMIYAETGKWPVKESDDSNELIREATREYPKLILINPELKKKLFSKEEYDYLVKLAKEEQEKEETGDK